MEKVRSERIAPTVSVVMPVYNGEAFHVRAAIESILSQSYSDYELIIVDDGCDNGVELLLAEYQSQFPKVRVECNSNNIGVVASRNVGLSLCRGEYVACMDSDDVAHVDRLKLQIDFMCQNPDADVCFTSFSHIDMGGGFLENFHVSEEPARLAAELFLNSRLCHSTMLCKRKAIKSVGGYPSGHDYADDYALYIKFLLGGYRIFGIDSNLLEYRISPSGLTRSRRAEQLRTAEEISFEYVSQKVDIRHLREEFSRFWFFIATRAETDFSLSDFFRIMPLLKYIYQDELLRDVWWPEILWITRKSIRSPLSVGALVIHLYCRFVFSS